MSLLAEPKRKIKWGLNPCGNLWSKDNAKYGQKILEKMGWKEGKGLGKLEDGCKEHVKVAFKHGNSGVGWDQSVSQEFIPCREYFGSLLTSLRQTHSGASDVAAREKVSLESKSRMSRKRVHYQKFVCSKDVSKYSMEDKECILGRKTDEIGNNDLDSHNSLVNGSTEQAVSIVSTDVSYGIVTYTSSSSMSDYFASKTKRRKLDDLQFTGKGEQESSSRTESDAGDSWLPAVCTEEPSLSKKKKSKRKKKKRLKQKEKKRAKMLDSSAPASLQDQRGSGHRDVQGREEGVHNTPGIKCAESAKSSGEACDTQERSEVQVPLKSCLKGGSVSSEIKTVTFSDDVCIERIPTRQQAADDAETLDSLSAQLGDCSESSETCSDQPKAEFCSDAAEDSKAVSERKKSEQSSTPPLQAYMAVPVFGGGSANSTPVKNTETWATTLKLAERMSHYSCVMENIPKHEILSTTNLLDIRGYGN